jgi:small nuclear ribonucleoprotein (snRNP)-like protein
MSKISDQLAVPKSAHDMDWLKSALQSALELEHATLPLYLAAMFSLEVQSYTTYNLIRSVAMEEMVHMAIAANVLAAIGGTPKFRSLTAPRNGYGLPGGAEPDLEVVLAQLSKLQLKNFMRLEMPLFLLPEEFTDERYPTISSLYDAIKQAIQANSEAVRAAVKKGGTSNQVGDNIGFSTITYSPDIDPVRQLLLAIDKIIEQGEGASNRLLHAPNFQGEESHYAKFAQIYYGGRYLVPKASMELSRDNEAEFFRGYPIGWPVVTNVLAVPADGYAKILEADHPNGAEVRGNLEAFDKTYFDILDDLEKIWNGPVDESWPMLGKAVGSMTELRVLSCFNIMRYQIPNNLVAKLPELYPDEYAFFVRYTRLNEPVFYGPRFHNPNT